MRSIIILISAAFFIITSCQKKIFFEIPIVEFEEDISISGEDSIVHLCFPNDKLGFAYTKSNYIYRTENGGSSWEKITFDGQDQCYGISFYNDSVGICSMNNIYRTEDAGKTWVETGSDDFRIKIYGEVSGITDEGLTIGGSFNSYEFTFYISEDSAKTFDIFNPITFYNNAFTIRSIKVSGNKIIITDTDAYLHTYDIKQESSSKYQAYLSGIKNEEYIYDSYQFEDEFYCVGSSGFLGSEFSNSFSDVHDNHYYDYYAVDGKNGLVVAVGENTITTNKYIYDEDIEWNEYYLKPGNTIHETFTEVFVLNNTTFYVGGKNGLIKKVKIP